MADLPAVAWKTSAPAPGLRRGVRRTTLSRMEETPLLVQPDPADPRLTRRVTGIDQTGARIEASVTVERPLTLYLNGQEIVTMMTILDRPEDLALGYLLNQGMLRRDDAVTGVEYDDDLQVVVVRTER